jgi:hypothetical protein
MFLLIYQRVTNHRLKAVAPALAESPVPAGGGRNAFPHQAGFKK